MNRNRPLKSLTQTKAVVSDHSRSHRVSPTHVVDRHAERLSQSPPFVRTGSPSSDGDRFNPFRRQVRAARDFVHRETGFLKQQINRFHKYGSERFVLARGAEIIQSGFTEWQASHRPADCFFTVL